MATFCFWIVISFLMPDTEEEIKSSNQINLCIISSTACYNSDTPEVVGWVVCSRQEKGIYVRGWNKGAVWVLRSGGVTIHILVLAKSTHLPFTTTKDRNSSPWICYYMYISTQITMTKFTSSICKNFNSYTFFMGTVSYNFGTALWGRRVCLSGLWRPPHNFASIW